MPNNTCKPQEVVVVQASCNKMSGTSNLDKWIIAVLIGIIFAIIASPFLFRVTNAIFKRLGFPTVDNNGVPNMFGIVLHTVILIILIRLLMH